jgi:hypothetical protein
MKKSELGIIVVIVVFSIGIAYFAGQAVLGKVAKKGVSVGTITKITGDVPAPDSSVFNSSAKNPTVQITIGNSSNQQPLAGQ